ncbi:MAG: hypothetical protein IKW62_02155 [Clostridia bacterium]|nr:hypothetical protein [Clostridia bacterium]
MNKRFLKFFSKFFSKPLVQIGFYILGILLIFFISGVFDDFKTSLSKIVNILSAQETISVFLAGILSLGMARIIKKCDYYLEESLKIDDDHHKIIRKYSGHKKTDIKQGKNYFDKTGVFMRINHVKCIKKSELKNREKDRFSKTYKAHEEDIKNFNEKKLYLPTVNVFTNTLGDTRLLFNDSNESHKLPSFVIEHADELLLAHKNSSTRNGDTIRLNDFYYDDEKKTLTLDTQRSTYYHMLITNRCMDYDFSNGLSIRKLYEFDKYICPLHKSKFGNQIGINGLIITSDGYVLIEKRDHNKTTWKNKFAQSISLALKVDEVILNKNGIIENTYEIANDSIKSVIEKTIKNNFGLTSTEYKEFIFEKNFLGLARDLLEGGKPNLYFYVETKCNAKELAKKLRETAKNDNVETALATEKLSSDYYLVKFSDIKINYNYVMNLNRRKAIKIARKVYPRLSRRLYLWDTIKNILAVKFKPSLKRECGEALLVTISYMEICKERIKPIKLKEDED